MVEYECQVVPLTGASSQDQDRLTQLGMDCWKLVSVSDGNAYMIRPTDPQLRHHVAAEGSALPQDPWSENAVEGERRIESITSLDAGPNGAQHTHRVVVIVDRDMNVLRGKTDEVDGHVHDVITVGVVDEADGHTHKFEVR